ncbi:MAG: phosphatase PAP2 family protein [Opitutaceae bacterium]|nr:phosphatase PAP2 family protein [Opitutaceae bacterium]
MFFALLAAAALFVHLAMTAPVGRYLPLEQQIMHAFRNADTGTPLGPAWLHSAIRDLTALGSAVVIILLTLLIFGYLLLTRQFAAAVLLAVATAGGQGANAGLKHIFARQRPDATMHLVEVRSLSFPSGHSMAASIFYLTTGALLTQTAKRRREKVYLISSALLVTALIGCSRVYLGVHYPTDVLAGWCAGTVWALLCWAIAEWLRRRGELAPAPKT